MQQNGKLKGQNDRKMIKVLNQSKERHLVYVKIGFFIISGESMIRSTILPTFSYNLEEFNIQILQINKISCSTGIYLLRYHVGS